MKTGSLKNIILILAVCTSACGGGGSGGNAGGGTVTIPPTGGTPPASPPTTTTCSLSNRQDFAFSVLNEWYLFPETLPSSLGTAPYSSVQSYIDALTATARSRPGQVFHICYFYAALTLAIPAQAEQTRTELAEAFNANAREAYVACYLLTQNANITEEDKEFRARSILCSMLSLKAATFHNGPTASADVPKAFQYCMLNTPEITDDPSRAMAYAYLAYFEKHAAVIGSASGEMAFLHAMAQKWPCP